MTFTRAAFDLLSLGLLATTADAGQRSQNHNGWSHRSHGQVNTHNGYRHDDRRHDRQAYGHGYKPAQGYGHIAGYDTKAAPTIVYKPAPAFGYAPPVKSGVAPAIGTAPVATLGGVASAPTMIVAGMPPNGAPVMIGMVPAAPAQEADPVAAPEAPQSLEAAPPK